MKPRAFLELFAGGAACTLALMGGAAVVPPVGYMGGKRKLAAGILGAAGLRIGQGAERVLLVDAGEWGGVWSEVVRDGRGLADRLLGWEGRDPSDLWRELAAAGRPEDPQERAAAYLWLQGRAASCTPVWWDADGSTTMARSASSGGGEQRVWQAGLVMPDPPRGGDCVVRTATERGDKLVMATGNGRKGGVCDAAEAQRLVMPSNGSHGPGLIRAHEKPARLVMADKPGRPAQRAQEMHPGPYGDAVERSREPKEKGRRSVGSGIMRPSTVAHRIIKAQAALLSWGGGVLVSRSHPTADDVAAWLGTPGDLRGVVALLDPPYVGATRYEATCTRAEVVALAEDYRRLGALVVVCETEALPELLAIGGWHPLDLRAATCTTGKPEWLTCSAPPDALARPRQLHLPLEVARA